MTYVSVILLNPHSCTLTIVNLIHNFASIAFGLRILQITNFHFVTATEFLKASSASFLFESWFEC